MFQPLGNVINALAVIDKAPVTGHDLHKVDDNQIGLIAADTVGNIFDRGNVYENVMQDNDLVLEVKYDSYIPEYIMQVLTGISAAQESVSKYIICSDRLHAKY